MKQLANKILAVGLVSVMLTLGIACNSVTALSYVQRLEPVVVNVLVLSCAISSGLPICGAMQGTIKADADLVIKLWGDYNAAVAAGTGAASVWKDLDAAFIVFENDSAAIFSDGLGLNAPEVTAIVSAAQVLLAAIEALFPPPPAGVAPGPRKFGAYRMGTGKHDKAWFNKWKHEYNEKVEVANKLHPNAKLSQVQ
jgi:hypothetical protein